MIPPACRDGGSYGGGFPYPKKKREEAAEERGIYFTTKVVRAERNYICGMMKRSKVPDKLGKREFLPLQLKKKWTGSGEIESSKTWHGDDEGKKTRLVGGCNGRSNLVRPRFAEKWL